MKKPRRPRKPPHDLQAVGKRLKEIRARHDLNQAQFAEAIGYSRGGYINYETGKRALPRAAQLQILQKFGDDPFQLSEGESGSPALPKILAEAPPANRWSVLVTKLREQRLLVQDAYRVYMAASHSRFGRVRVAVFDHLFLIFGLMYCLRLGAISFNLPIGAPIGNVDWVLLLSAFGLLVLMPVQIAGMIRFALWQRRSGRLSGQP